MNKFKGIILAVLCMAAVTVQAQSVMRGETSPGVYTNVSVDATGAVKTTGASGGASTTAGPIAPGTPAANSDLIGGYYKGTPPVIADGQQAAIPIGQRGALWTQLMLPDSTGQIGTVTASIDGVANGGINALNVRNFNVVYDGVQGNWSRQRGDTTGTYMVRVASPVGGYAFSNISTNATTTVKTGAGFLHTLNVGTAGSTSNIKCYDSTTATGTVITTLSTLSAETFTFDLAFATGLTCVTAGGTAADVTITYK